jgi:hypothetical protein
VRFFVDLYFTYVYHQTVLISPERFRNIRRGLVRFLISVIFVFILTGCVVAFPESPLKNAKPGDWAEIKQTINVDGQNVEQFVRQEVIKRDAESVTIKTVTATPGAGFVENEMTILLRQILDFFPVDSNPEKKMAPTSEGDETITSGGRAYHCHRMEYLVSHSMQGQMATTTTTVWTCPDVPFAQMVKMVVEQQTAEKKIITTKELMSFGLGKGLIK